MIELVEFSAGGRNEQYHLYFIELFKLYGEQLRECYGIERGWQAY